VVTDYEGLIQSLLVPFLDAVNGVGGEVQQQGAYVAQVLGAQREMLVQVARMPQPSEDDFMEMLQSTNEALALVDECNEVLSLSMQRGSLPLNATRFSPSQCNEVLSLSVCVPLLKAQVCSMLYKARVLSMV